VLTAWAAFLASGTMAVAYAQFHWKLQLGSALLPPIDKGELARFVLGAVSLHRVRGRRPV